MNLWTCIGETRVVREEVEESESERTNEKEPALESESGLWKYEPVLERRELLGRKLRKVKVKELMKKTCIEKWKWIMEVWTCIGETRVVREEVEESESERINEKKTYIEKWIMEVWTCIGETRVVREESESEWINEKKTYIGKWKWIDEV